LDHTVITLGENIKRTDEESMTAKSSRSSLVLPICLALLSPFFVPESASAAPAAPAKTQEKKPAKKTGEKRPYEPADLYASTYRPLPSRPTLITNATVLTAAGDRIEGGSVLLRDGKIAAVGQQIQTPAGAVVIDARGKWVTPGVIDAHSHLGVYPSPGVEAHEDGNESTDPVTSEVWAEHSIWPQDPQIPLALAGGVTTQHILPGSANLIGGRSVTIKNVPGRAATDMKFPGAPYGLKMACGENPKRNYGERGRSPATRMGNIAVTRTAWTEALDYREDWAEHYREIDAGEDSKPPEREVAKETLLGVLDGKILVQNHCYRADEMLVMIQLANEFGYKIAAFHHAVEAYKIADVLAENGICSAMWADSWGFKMEAFDGIRENVALVDRPKGSCSIVHSDSALGIQRLNQEAAKSMAAGRRMGFPLREEDAIRWITVNPARALGIEKQTGTLEEGKMADVVIWSGNPFSVYSKAEQVYIDGALIYDRNDPARQPQMDFDLGILGATGGAR
jgi:imidazolonepropionase-like amidohydrolase